MERRTIDQHFPIGRLGLMRSSPVKNLCVNRPTVGARLTSSGYKSGGSTTWAHAVSSRSAAA